MRKAREETTIVFYTYSGDVSVTIPANEKGKVIQLFYRSRFSLNDPKY